MSDEDGLTYMRDGKMVVPFRMWNGDVIHMLTPDELRALPDGTVVTCTDGRRLTKGVDYISDDVRKGRTIFGLPA